MGAPSTEAVSALIVAITGLITAAGTFWRSLHTNKRVGKLENHSRNGGTNEPE